MARTKQKQLDNPFVYQGYEGPKYFCDREKETENMISALNNGRNITLISPRKIGKTGLINHAFYQIKTSCRGYSVSCQRVGTTLSGACLVFDRQPVQPAQSHCPCGCR